MVTRVIATALLVLAVPAPLTCASSVADSERGCNETAPLVYLEYGFGNVLDGFSGTFTKDLVLDPDTTVVFRLSDEELWRILAKADSVGFFTFPDTVRAHPEMRRVPDPSPDVLRLKVGDRDHTVVWYYPIDSSWPRWESLLVLSGYIRGLVESKEEYKTLPAPRGGYR